MISKKYHICMSVALFQHSRHPALGTSAGRSKCRPDVRSFGRTFGISAGRRRYLPGFVCKKNTEVRDECMIFFTPDALVGSLGTDFRYESFSKMRRKLPSRVLPPSDFSIFMANVGGLECWKSAILHHFLCFGTHPRIPRIERRRSQEL